jgi:hypothetical protein
MGGAVRLRVDVDREPLAPGDAVAGRVVVEDGGRARSLFVRLALVERTKDFHALARVAGEEVVADGDLADGAVVPFALRLPPDAPPTIATAHARLGWELRARADRLGPDAHVDRPIEVDRG